MGTRKKYFNVLWPLAICLLIGLGCQGPLNTNITRDNFSDTLTSICRNKYQTHVTCRIVEETLWVYLPTTSGRRGSATTEQKDNDLFLQYAIASFNPYRVLEPPELKFLVQKVLGEIRQLLLRSAHPYKFFVLVVTDIESPVKIPPYEDWYIGYFDDVKNYSVGADFSGEGYSRLVWHNEPIGFKLQENGQKILASFGDTKGEHVPYRAMTMREFVEKQIKWRIYKRFTIGYNKIPFDLTPQEKEDEIIHIIKTVFGNYQFTEFEKVYLKDASFLSTGKDVYEGHNREDLDKYEVKPLIRKPAF